MNPDISVVLCTYNRAKMLGPALESLVRQETQGQFTFEIVVVDDGSTDNTQTILQKIAIESQAPLRYLPGEGRGIAAARNTGVAAAAGKWIASFDDDQIAEPDWLKELFSLALKTGSHCVGGARFLLLTKEELSQLSPVCRAVLGEIVQGNEPRKCGRKQYPCTGNMLLKRSVFDQVGQFDESWTGGGSDIELTTRLRRAGLEAWFTPKAIVHHQVPSYRLDESYLSWTSLRIGTNFAHRDYREWGLPRSIFTCIARVAQAAFINFPLMLLAYILGNRAEAIGRKCLLLRAWGYLRQSLNLISPRVLSQETYFSGLSFRNERNAFAGSSKSSEWRGSTK
jgi:glycosyltransferase involved in cell wall biosynthesis